MVATLHSGGRGRKVGPLATQRKLLILRFVESRQGCSLRDISGGTGIRGGVLHYYLRPLVASRSLVVVRVKRAALHYTPEKAPVDAVAAWLARDEQLRRLWMWVKESCTPRTGSPQMREVSQGEVVQATASWGWTRTSTQRRLGHLLSTGRVVQRTRARKVVYSLGSFKAVDGKVARGGAQRTLLNGPWFEVSRG
jgi:hypothetical protein